MTSTSIVAVFVQDQLAVHGNLRETIPTAFLSIFFTHSILVNMPSQDNAGKNLWVVKLLLLLASFSDALQASKKLGVVRIEDAGDKSWECIPREITTDMGTFNANQNALEVHCEQSCEQKDWCKHHEIITEWANGTCKLYACVPQPPDISSDEELAWFHAPRTGKNFVETLMHYADESGMITENMHYFGEVETLTADLYEKYSGRFFGMFRPPGDRTYSSWNVNGRPFNISGGDFLLTHPGPVTKQLAGQAIGVDAAPQVNLAAARLEGFAFVGLTDHWNLSVCLFHAMHGGTMLPEEFQNLRPGDYSQDMEKQHNNVMYYGWQSDVYDTEIYAKASNIFWSNVKKYEVRLSTCALDDMPHGLYSGTGEATGRIRDDCGMKRSTRLITDPRWFWNKEEGKNIMNDLQPYIDSPPQPPSARSSSGLAIIMLADDGHVAHHEIWSAWVEHAQSQGIQAKLYIHSSQKDKVPQNLIRFVVPFQRNSSWCNCRAAIMDTMEYALTDSGVTHVAIASSNSIPIKSLLYIHSELDQDPSSRMCQDRTWDVPRAETWWMMSRFDAELVLAHRVSMASAIEHGMCADTIPGPSCVDENSWLTPLLLRNSRWGQLAPLRDECIAFADWGGTCKQWAVHSAACNCPNLLKARTHATAGHPAQFRGIDGQGFSELLESPFWFARKFDEQSFAPGWDPVGSAAARWEKEGQILMEKKIDKIALGADGDLASNEISAQCDATVLKALHDRGPGMIVSGHAGALTQVVQQVFDALQTHDFGTVESVTRDSLAVRDSMLVDKLEDFERMMVEVGSLNYEAKDVKPMVLRERLLYRACDSLKRISLESKNQDRPWALQSPLLRLYLPFYDSVVGIDNYKFVHVTQDVRKIQDADFERYNFALHTVHLNTAFRIAKGDGDILSRWAGKVDIEKWIRFAYVWGIVELDLYFRWKRERSQNYLHITETDILSTNLSARLATFVGGSTSAASVDHTASSTSQPDIDHFEMMDAVIKLPGLEMTLKALTIFGYQ